MLCCGGLEWPWVRDSLAYAPGVIVFLFFPVLSPGGCESMWVAALTVVLPCAILLCVVGSFTVFTVRCCHTVEWVFLFTVCSWFFHCSLQGTCCIINWSYITYCHSSIVGVLCYLHYMCVLACSFCVVVSSALNTVVFDYI